MIVSDLLRFSLGVTCREWAEYKGCQSGYLIGKSSAQSSPTADESSFRGQLKNSVSCGPRRGPSSPHSPIPYTITCAVPVAELLYSRLDLRSGLRASCSSSEEEKEMAMRPRICFTVLFLPSYIRCRRSE
jgi:hypothetical protein